ncbi:MAG: hypothetical protein Q8O86_11885 [Dehalococcoidia bacterium]|nr:hypothetical protein [Dehalococcoidia bacterium]
MRLDEFVAKWSKAKLKERSAAQEHFIDLCRLLEHPTPAEADAEGSSFTFEKGAKLIALVKQMLRRGLSACRSRKYDLYTQPLRPQREVGGRTGEKMNEVKTAALFAATDAIIKALRRRQQAGKRKNSRRMGSGKK